MSEERERHHLGLNGPLWDHVLSFDEELFDVGADHADIHGAGPSSVGGDDDIHNDERGDGGDDEGVDGGDKGGHRNRRRGKAPMKEADERESDINEDSNYAENTLKEGE
ncbi:hypothetical protein CJ030_MR2G022147 [Morella rubra]|uniref:Uncharacterized protein n=1 Tax=Morella rubra TaxID=262757 RepID=A0A6A1WGC0_9ROSI|nr:hypothetical protein CJ030_MR2G022147 [Morella rubra]